MHSLQAWKVTKPLDEGAAKDEELLRAAKAGDLEALDRLLRGHQRALFTLCRDILQQPEDAEDAVQETYLRALRAIPRFRGDASVRTWLFRIAVHICLDWKARPRTEPFIDGSPALTVLTCMRSPEANTLNRLYLGQALAQLLPRQRAILLLKEWLGLSVAEVAVCMDWNAKRVQNELFKARRKLADWVAHQEKEEGERL